MQREQEEQGGRSLGLGAIAAVGTAAATALLCGLLAVGCGRGDERSTTPVPPPSAAPEAHVPGGGGDVAAPIPPPTPSAVETCNQLADQEDWAKALDPCTRAAVERPDDLKIRHALQQARAAAADTLAN